MLILPAEVAMSAAGGDILPLMEGKEGAKSPHKAIYGFTATGRLMSVRYQNWKLILPGKHWTANLENPNLYDVEKDPGETENLADEHTDVVQTIMAMANEATDAIKNNKPLDE